MRINKEVYDALLNHYAAQEDPVEVYGLDIPGDGAHEEEDELEDEEFYARIYQLVDGSYFALVQQRADHAVLDCLGPFDSIEAGKAGTSLWRPSS